MTLSPGGATFPVTVQINIGAPSNEASASKASKFRYGLSDPKATSFEDSEEEAGKPEAHFDTHVKTGPLHVGIARTVIPYNSAIPLSRVPSAILWSCCLPSTLRSPSTSPTRRGGLSRVYWRFPEPLARAAREGRHGTTCWTPCARCSHRTMSSLDDARAITRSGRRG
jgi:hypothetical protein